MTNCGANSCCRIRPSSSWSQYRRPIPRSGEASLDGVLLRPYTAASLAERIIEARRRKAELADLVGALAAGQSAQAIELCLARYQRSDS